MLRYLLALWLVSCGPPPVVVVPDGPGDCTSACANLERLGGCGIDLTNCEGLCRDAEQAEAELGVTFPVGCFSASQSCDEAGGCS